MVTCWQQPALVCPAPAAGQEDLTAPAGNVKTNGGRRRLAAANKDTGNNVQGKSSEMVVPVDAESGDRALQQDPQQSLQLLLLPLR